MRESQRYLKEQIITYIGNKRHLLHYINAELQIIKKKLGKDKISCVDLFSGSGVVSRLMKQHSDLLISNDLEIYSEIINNCYLSNRSNFNENLYNEYYNIIKSKLEHPTNGLISNHYAPQDDNNIKPNERVFYTCQNAAFIDTVRDAIDFIDRDYQKYFLAPLLYEASVHNNTAGLFKGFYKDRLTRIGKFGGTGENALSRIKGKIELSKPVLSNFECDYQVYRHDANDLVKNLDDTDLIYIDPPYNQHPYGSNYFMLNIIASKELPKELSPVSGIPVDWNRSDYNRRAKVKYAFNELIDNAKSRFLIISYNSDGFISLEEMKSILKPYGKLKTKKIKYNTYRGSRNLKSRDIYVNEYLFILEKKTCNLPAAML